MVAPTKVAPLGEMNFPWEGISLGKRGPSCHGEKGTWDSQIFGENVQGVIFFQIKNYLFLLKFFQSIDIKNDFSFSI